MDDNLQIRLEQNKIKRETMQRKSKGQLNLNEVGVKGSVSKVIKRPEPLKDTEKQTVFKDAVAKGAKPKTITTQ